MKSKCDMRQITKVQKIEKLMIPRKRECVRAEVRQKCYASELNNKQSEVGLESEDVVKKFQLLEFVLQTL